MSISAERKWMSTFKEPFRCKLEIDLQIIQHELNMTEKVRQEVIKANKSAGCLNGIIWRNKYLSRDTKARIYQTTIRSVVTYISVTK